MSDEVLIAILLLMAAALAWVFVWIAGHHKDCHRAPGEALAALTERVDGVEEECRRLAKNAHDDRNHNSRVSLWVELIKEKLGMGGP